MATQATAHSLHTQAWAAARPLTRQRQSAVGLHLRNPSLMDYYSYTDPGGWQAESALLAD